VEINFSKNFDNNSSNNTQKSTVIKNSYIFDKEELLAASQTLYLKYTTHTAKLTDEDKQKIRQATGKKISGVIYRIIIFFVLIFFTAFIAFIIVARFDPEIRASVYKIILLSPFALLLWAVVRIFNIIKMRKADLACQTKTLMRANIFSKIDEEQSKNINHFCIENRMGIYFYITIDNLLQKISKEEYMKIIEGNYIEVCKSTISEILLSVKITN